MVTRLQERTDGVSEYRSLCRCLWIHIRVTKGAVDLQTPFGFNQCIQPSNSPGHARARVSQPAFGCSPSCLWVKIRMLSIWHNRAVIMRCGRQRVNRPSGKTSPARRREATLRGARRNYASTTSQLWIAGDSNAGSSPAMAIADHSSHVSIL